MPNQDSKYDSLINTLRNSKPVAENAGIITERIMLSVQGNKRIRPNKIIVWLRPLLTSAALVLLGLLFYQTSSVENIKNEDQSGRTVKLVLIQKDYCGFISTGKMQVTTALFSQYKCYMRSNSLENEVSKKVFSKYLSQIQKSEVQ
jgi:hypothetical protein